MSPRHQHELRRGNVRVRSGVVRGRWWADRPIRGYPARGIRMAHRRAHDAQMHLHTTTVPSRNGRDSVMGGTLVGTLLVIGGLWLAYVAWSTPVLAAISAAVSAAIRPDATASQPGMLMLALALAVPAAFVVVGTNRLARTAGAVRGAWGRRGDRLLRSLPDDVVLVRDLTLDDGRPAPALLVGAFGLVAMIEASEVSEDDVTQAMRDADRVRHWLTQNDQDFVVRVHAAVVGGPVEIERPRGCALLTIEDIPAWLESLPRQRSLNEARLARLVRLVKPRG